MLITTTYVSTGKFTHRIDKALPGKHTKTLYTGRSKVEAGILCRLKQLKRTCVHVVGNRNQLDLFLFRCPRCGWSNASLSSRVKIAKKSQQVGRIYSLCTRRLVQAKGKTVRYRSWKPTPGNGFGNYQVCIGD